MLFATLLIIAAAVVLMVRGVDVRLVLLAAGLLLAVLAGRPLTVTDTFTKAMVAGIVAPICAAMGFAMVVTATGCDRHLVHLLLAPLGRTPFLLLPGGIITAYLVNMAIPSQTSTAAALGPIVVPLLLAAGYSPAVAGAALLLGASFGGDLLNPGGPDVQSVAGVTHVAAAELSKRIIPASLAGALAATAVFTLLNGRKRVAAAAAETAVVPSTAAASDAGISTDFRVNLVRAAIPLVPITLLLLAFAGVPWLAWLVAAPSGAEWAPLANALPVVRAMLIGTAVAAAVCWRDIARLTASFFDGMGLAYAGIISLTICAQCFGAGIAAVGVADYLLSVAGRSGGLPLLSAAFPWTMAVLSGSGSGPILAFAETFLRQMNADEQTTRLAALACLGGAVGRTMSPVAAVVIYTSGLVNVPPILLIKNLLPALVVGGLLAMLLAAAVAAAPAPAGAVAQLKGQFVYEGALPQRKQRVVLNMIIADESLIVDPKSLGIANVVVYLRASKQPAVAMAPRAQPRAVVHLRIQPGRWRFEPHVVLMQTGEALSIHNPDQHAYNPNIVSAVNSWNSPIAANYSKQHIMVRAEKTPVKITDNIVPWMEAVLLVQDHPFMAVTDRDGRFTIKGLPVGKELEFQLWHERMGYLSGTWLTQSQVAKVDTKGRFKLKIENGKNDLGAIHVGAAAFREGHK